MNGFERVQFVCGYALKPRKYCLKIETCEMGAVTSVEFNTRMHDFDLLARRVNDTLILNAMR